MKLNQRNLKKALSESALPVDQRGTPLGVVLETQDPVYLLNRTIEKLLVIKQVGLKDPDTLSESIFLLGVLKVLWTPPTSENVKPRRG